MKKLLALILLALSISSISFADITNQLNIEEEDGTPSTFPYKLKVTNGTLTDNLDGTVSLTTGGGGGGSSTVNTSDIATVPYYVSRTNLTGDVNSLWDAVNNTHIISEDAGQLGSVLAFSINNKNGFSVANISHDGSAAFNKINLSTDLAVRDGGTGASSFTANGVMLGNGFSALNVTTADTATNHFLGSTATTPAFRQIMAQDIAFAGNANALTYYPTATTLGTLTADTTAGHVLVSTATLPNFRQLLTSDVSGTHSLAQGGTGITSGTANALVYFPNTGVMGSLTADTTAGHTLFSTTTLPSFRQALTSDSTGTMPVARGGTGITTGNSNGVVYMQNAGLMTTTTADTATNHFLASTATAPAFRQFITTDIAAGVLGFAAGGTGQSTNSLGDILVGNTNGWQKFTVGANGTVLSADSSEPLGVKWVAPPGAGGGEVNTASNLGTGNQLFESKSGVDLRFRTLTSSDNVVMTTNANDVAISVPSIPSNDIVGTIGSNNGGTGQTTSTKGDLLVSDGVGWQKLTVGANGTILSADSAQATGVKWATQSVGGGSVTGSGEDGQVTYWTSSTNISSNPSFAINYTGTSNTVSISRDLNQRGNLLNISSDTGALMSYVSYDGSIAINTNSPQLQGKLNVSSDSTTTIPIRVRQPASSTVNAQTWESGTGTTQAAISSDGSGQFGGTIAVRPVDGSFGYDGTTQKAFHYGAAGMSQDLVGVIYTSTANVANINRTSNVSFIDPLSGDIGTNVLPANFWTVGKTVRVKSMGKFRTTANPTMNFSLNLGGRTLVTTNAINMPTTVNNKYWIVDGYLQCRQTGASGRVMAWSTLTRQGSTAVSTDSIGMMSSDAAIINTTNAASIDIVTAWGTANALNVISADITTIEVLR